MKLGTQTGSLINHVPTNNVASPEPVVGMAATLCCWSDRHACTVTEFDGKLLWIQKDIAIRVDNRGMSECQTYVYTNNPEGSRYVFKKDRNGDWRQCARNSAGRWVFASIGGRGGMGLVLGRRETYQDYSF